ncbi:MAG: hypothetical protein K6F33_13495 [Bacteroidales bacterium]|nr:hypothetical protein [Bacteroidales bacterium]
MFSYIYDWLSALYAPELNDYLWGFNCNTQSFSNPEHHTFYGLWMLGSSIAIAAIYYLAINSPRFNHRFHWLLFMILTFAVNFFIGFYFTNADMNSGLIPDCLMYQYDAQGNVIGNLIYQTDCLMFGLSNAIFAAVFYFIASIGLKYASRNCKVVPF